ncbi:hypothetical protein SNEBB_010935 [Seison nebaliae]|nr:hypothetical protein SNEBB_010935 [Seison nebaliae]
MLFMKLLMEFNTAFRKKYEKLEECVEDVKEKCLIIISRIDLIELHEIGCVKKLENILKNNSNLFLLIFTPTSIILNDHDEKYVVVKGDIVGRNQKNNVITKINEQLNNDCIFLNYVNESFKKSSSKKLVRSTTFDLVSSTNIKEISNEETSTSLISRQLGLIICVCFICGNKSKNKDRFDLWNFISMYNSITMHLIPYTVCRNEIMKNLSIAIHSNLLKYSSHDNRFILNFTKYDVDSIAKMINFQINRYL